MRYVEFLTEGRRGVAERVIRQARVGLTIDEQVGGAVSLGCNRTSLTDVVSVA